MFSWEQKWQIRIVSDHLQLHVANLILKKPIDLNRRIKWHCWLRHNVKYAEIYARNTFLRSVWELMHKHCVLYCSRHHCSAEIFPVWLLYCFFLTQLRPFTCSFITGRLQSCSFTGLIGPWLEKREPICTPSNHYLLNMSFSELSLFLFTHSGVGGPAPY